MIVLDVRGGARALPEAVRRRLLRRLGRAMVAAGVGTTEVSLSLVDNRRIRRLNHAYLREDRATDVLSFSQRQGEAPVAPPGAAELLGDIVISTETAARQARARGAAIDAELLHLAVHGLVHLCGFNHRTAQEEKVMFGWEAGLRQEAAGRRAPRTIPAPR